MPGDIYFIKSLLRGQKSHAHHCLLFVYYTCTSKKTE